MCDDFERCVVHLKPIKNRSFKSMNDQEFFGIINNVRGAYNKFPDFFHTGTFIDSTHMKLYSP